MRCILVAWVVLGGGCAWIVDPDPATYPDAATPSGDACPGDSCGPAAMCSTPTPPGSEQCPAACTGGCAGGVCTIDCASVLCETQTIECPPDHACIVNCIGIDACDTSVVDCPDDFDCTLNCGPGVDACGDVDLDCDESAAACRITCFEGSCSGAEVLCERGDCSATCTGPPGPTVSCDPDSECACQSC